MRSFICRRGDLPDGNSLGPLPLAAQARMQQVLSAEWGEQLIRGWNSAGWYTQPRRVGDRIAALLGAPAGSVVMGDTLSIKVYQALAGSAGPASGAQGDPVRQRQFPDGFIHGAGTVLGPLGQGHELRVVEPEAVAALDDRVAVLMLTQVDYCSGRMHDMRELTALAHQHGALTIWDLAHSAGAVPVDLTAAAADFAVGCTYKYLNGGPGAPAFIYVAPQHAEQAQPVLSGWMGHAAPFAFDPDYRAAAGIERMRIGTPPVLALAVLEAALDVWDEVSMADVRARSIALCELFIREVETACPQLELASPRAAEQRGSQVSFRFEHGYAAMQALIARGVIGDFRAPDIMRFGFTPLYIGEKEVRAAVQNSGGSDGPAPLGASRLSA
ncbi:MAG: aminotransferase class V-fold PLP-dependent enzyme [Thiolinea sp.]